jgi:hypothetical protein
MVKPVQSFILRATIAVALIAVWFTSGGAAPQVAPPPAPQTALPPAPQTGLPAPAAIVARHVLAIGGEQAYRAVRSIHARGRLEIPAQGLGGDLDLQLARPDKLLYRVSVPGIGIIENGYNGKTGWSLSPIIGPELLSGRQLSEAADDAWFDGTLHGPEHVRQMTTVDREDYDGRPAYKLKVVFASGNEETEFFDVETGFQIGSQADRTTPQGVIPTVNIFRNYRRFGAVMQATIFIQRALGFEQVVTISSCEFDTVPDTAFDPPAQVKALLNR